MSFLPDDALHDLGNLIDGLILRKSICPCINHVSTVIKIKENLLECNDRHVVKAEILPDCLKGLGFQGDNFIRPARVCAHDGLTEFTVHFDKRDADLIIPGEKVLLYNAINGLCRQPPFIDARNIRTGALRLPQESAGESYVNIIELFAGGFSGWSHAIRSMIDGQIPMKHLWSLDHDHRALDTFVKTHQHFQHVKNSEDALRLQELKGITGLEQSMAIQSDVRDAWFMKHLDPAWVDIGVMSPPCQPWSWAHTAHGLLKAEGRTFAYGCGIMICLRPKILCIEEVSGFYNHQHYPLVKRLLRECGYEVLDQRCLNLNQVLPQSRDRWLCIAVDKHASGVAKFLQWIPWPKSPKSCLRNTDCIMKLSNDDLHPLIPDEKIVKKYLDISLLPRSADDFLQSQRPKTKAELRKYRIRDMESQQVSCIMANYGKATDLPEHVLKQGGIYGSLLLQRNVLRFLHASEVAMLMGATNPVFLPYDHGVQMHILGNGIAVPHALICLLNAVRLLAKISWEIDIQSTFAQVMSRRLRASQVEIVQCAAGIVIQPKQSVEPGIELTQPIQTFVTLHIRSPTSIVHIQVETGLNIKTVIETLTGESCPRDMDLCVDGKFPVQLMEHDQVDVDNCIIKVNVPSVLDVTDVKGQSIRGDMIMVLTGGGIVVCKRNGYHTVQALSKTIHEFFPDQIERTATPRNEFGQELPEASICPDQVFMSSGCQKHVEFTPVDIPTFKNMQSHFEMMCSTQMAFKVINVFDRAGLIEGCKCLGWAIQLIPSKGVVSHRLQVILAPMSGSLAVPMKLIEMFVLTNLSIVNMPVPIDESNDDDLILVKVKMWNVLIWEGKIDKKTEVGMFLNPWKQATTMMNTEESSMRAVIQGNRANPDFPTGEYAKSNEVRLHLVLSMHGGGKVDAAIEAKNAFAVFMIQQGADLQQTTHLADVMLRSVGLQTLQKNMLIDRIQDRLDALKKLTSTIHATWPEFTRSDSARFQRVQQSAKQKQLKVSGVKAAQISLIPETFENEDQTPTEILSQISQGASGVVLMDAEAAAPWVVDQQCISSDELCVLVLGHECPGKKSKYCKQVQIPATNEAGKPLVITACMHNLGQKSASIKINKQDDVPVCPTTIIAITIFRDEIALEDWHHVEQHPVKFALNALGIQDSMALQSPPWGRSWQNKGVKSDPSQATSLQFHARIETSKLTTFMKASGRQGTYVVPKLDSNLPDTTFAVVWIDASVVELTKTMVGVPEHLGLVRINRGKGDNSRISRGIRCKRDDFVAIFPKLRPGVQAPNVTPVSHLYKLQPCPRGATADVVNTWLQKQSMDARPLKALSGDTWLIGATNMIEQNFWTWNGKSIMMTAVQSRYQHKQSPIIAGNVMNTKGMSKGNPKNDGGDFVFNSDPWATYTPTSQSSLSSARVGMNAGGAQVTRSVDAPTEARFKKADEQMAILEKQVKDLQKHVENRDIEDKRFQSNVTTEFQNVRSEIQKQVSSISNKFEQSLQHALSKQDVQIQSGFDDIKQMLRSANGPNPAKKAKATPREKPEHGGEDDKEDHVL